MSGLLIGLAAALLALLLFSVLRLEKQEMASFDMRLRWRAGTRLRDNDSKVLIVAVDDKTWGTMPGIRWPLPRGEYVRLVRLLKDAGAKSLGFDIYFEEPDPPQDRLLAAALRDAGNAYLGIRFDPIKAKNELSWYGEQVPIGKALDRSLVAIDPPGAGRMKVRMRGAALPSPELAEAARGVGSLTILPETDGVVRLFPLVAAYDGPGKVLEPTRLYASLPLLVAADYLGVPLRDVRVRLGEALEIGPRRIPINASGETTINYYGEYRRALAHLSYVDVVQGRYPPRYFRDKIVLVGNTIPGGFDIQVTPFGGQYPGVEIQGTVIQNLLDRSAIRQVNPVASVLLLLAVSLAVGVTRAFSVRAQAATAVALSVGIAVVGFCALSSYCFWIEMVRPLLAVLLAFLGVSVSTYHEEHTARARVQGAVDALAEVTRAIEHTRSPMELHQALEQGIGRVLGVAGVRLSIDDPRLREHFRSEDTPAAVGDRRRRLPIALHGKEVGCILAPVPEASENQALIAAVANFAGMALENSAFFEESHSGFLSLTLMLADIIESNDQYTAGHCRRVMEYACAIGGRLELSPFDMEELRFGALLHDVGKTVLDKPVLNKPGALTFDEMEEVRRHPALGGQWLRREKRLHGVSDLVASHHERWDGAGYPEGLAGEQIPLGGRILAAADVWDALTTDRAYRQALSFEEARCYLVEGRGTQFDPRVIDAFLPYLDDDAR